LRDFLFLIPELYSPRTWWWRLDKLVLCYCDRRWLVFSDRLQAGVCHNTEGSGRPTFKPSLCYWLLQAWRSSLFLLLRQVPRRWRTILICTATSASRWYSVVFLRNFSFSVALLWFYCPN